MDAELEFDARLFVGDFHLDVELAIPTGPVLLVGPAARARHPAACPRRPRSRGWDTAGPRRDMGPGRAAACPRGTGSATCRRVAPCSHISMCSTMSPSALRAGPGGAPREGSGCPGHHGAGSLTGRTPRTLSGGEHSGSRWPARWCGNPRCSSSTSLWRHWMSARDGRSDTCSPRPAGCRDGPWPPPTTPRCPRGGGTLVLVDDGGVHLEPWRASSAAPWNRSSTTPVPDGRRFSVRGSARCDCALKGS